MHAHINVGSSENIGAPFNPLANHHVPNNLPPFRGGTYDLFSQILIDSTNRGFTIQKRPNHQQIALASKLTFRPCQNGGFTVSARIGDFQGQTFAKCRFSGKIYIHTYITLHYITLRYVTLHYITLHYINSPTGSTSEKNQ